MKVIFISNVLTPHQVHLCDELHENRDIVFKFIEGCDIDKSTLPVGWRFTEERDYVVTHRQLMKNFSHYMSEINEADAVIYGSAPFELIKNRVSEDKLTFIYSERIYKNIRQWLKYPFHLFRFARRYWGKKNSYLLAASAFSTGDYNKLGCFINKSLKWGYFTAVPAINIKKNLEAPHRDVSRLKILYTSRFLFLKHPDIPIKVAEKLRALGIPFELNMFGDGPLYAEIQSLIVEKGLRDCVKLHGCVANSSIIKAMQDHDIFLFTSDKNEGWGAVSNEAMSNGCVLIASDAIGSAPFLIKEGVTGFMFRDQDIHDLTAKVLLLANDKELRKRIAENAYRQMTEIWSPESAASRLVHTISSIMNNASSDYDDGPCSFATNR